MLGMDLSSSVNRPGCVGTGSSWELGWMWELWQSRRGELAGKFIRPGALQRAAVTHVAQLSSIPQSSQPNRMDKS